MSQTSTEFTTTDKLKELETEMKYRKHVYPRLVAQRKMQQATADRRLAIMEAIHDDYLKNYVAPQSELFGEAKP